MSDGCVVGVQTGRPSSLSFDGASLKTGIFKASVGTAFVTRTGLRGDVQVDRKNHGGVDKAVCVYPSGHYATWSAEEGLHLGPGAFGENLTIQGVDETSVRIGDRYDIGEAVFEVSQPRQPCHKLSKKIGDIGFAERVIATGRTGFYFRVLHVGRVSTGDAVVLTARGPDHATIDAANGIMYRSNDSLDALRAMLDVRALSDSWRHTLSARLT